MKFKILLSALISVPLLSMSQNVQVNLSPQHCEKLNKLNNAKTKLLKYFRYYRRDSVRQTRQKLRREKKLIMRELLNARDVMPLPFAVSGLRPLDYVEIPDSLHLSSDPLATLPSLRLEAARGGTIPDSLFSLFPRPDDVYKDVASKLPRDLTGQNAANADTAISPVSVNAVSAEVTDQIPIDMTEIPRELPDRDSLVTIAKMHAIRLAQSVKMPDVQKKITKIMTRYRAFGNAGNPSEGVRRTSLEGLTILERLVIGGTFNVVSTQPLSIDIAPRIGYRLSTRFQTGFGVNIRHTWGDSLRFDRTVSSQHLSYRAYVRHELPRSFFAYTEWERVRLPKAQESSDARWLDAAFVGAGRKFLVHPACYMTVTALYHISAEEQSSVYARRFQVRIGFELSELATRRKTFQYHPNRTR